MGAVTEKFEALFQDTLANTPDPMRMLSMEGEITSIGGTDARRVLRVTLPDGRLAVLKQYEQAQAARLRAEKDVLSSVHCKGVPRLLAYAEDDEWVYLLRDYIDGFNLEELLTLRGTLPVAEILDIGIQLCDVLTCLHTAQPKIIHRDIKPQNIIYTAEKQAVLIDFDIARKYDEQATHDTEYLGTRTTAPPEQFGFGQTDERSDLYALGVVLVYLYTGDYRVQSLGDMPRELARICKCCTDFSPANRYASAALLKRQLLRAKRAGSRRAARAIAAVACALLLLLCGYLLGRNQWFRAESPYALTQLSADAVVAFQSPEIEACVRQQLGKTEREDVVFSDLAAITEIHMYGALGFDTPRTVEYVGDRCFVDGVLMHNGTVSDLSDLALMPNLRCITFYRNQIKDISVLGALTKLEEVVLSENPIEEISSLRYLPYLNTLNLADTNVNDITPLRDCKRLRFVDLHRIPCEDFSPLRGFHYLETLNVFGCDASAVRNAIDGNIVDNLWLDFCNLKDVEVFQHAESIRELHAKYNSIVTLEGIQRLTTLEYVDVAFNPIEDLSPLLALPRLTAVNLSRDMLAAWQEIEEQANFRVQWQEPVV